MPSRPALRRALLAGVCLSLSAVTLTLPAATAVTADQAQAMHPGGPDPAESRATTRRSQVMTGQAGRAFARSAARTPRAAARDYLSRYAARWGVAPEDLELTSVVPSRTGGDIVRLRQHIGGLPVVGGDVVLSLDADRGLRSASARLSSSDPLAPGSISPDQARRTAALTVASDEDVDASTLTTAHSGEWAYDASTFGAPLSAGVRRVHRVEVRSARLSHTVLVDSGSGRVLADLDERHAATNRLVCDTTGFFSPGLCQTGNAVRVEGSEPSGKADADAAYDNLGATAQMYADVAGLDLAALIGSTAEPASLRAWIGVCEPGNCPMRNAYWDRGQVFFGAGFSRADDVVAHELTHGVIEKSSDLFYFYQSGAINESIADVLGEVVDRRTSSPGETPDEWLLGEDLPVGATRSLSDPTAYDQPDRMTSAIYAGGWGNDNGGVHINSGVGNKTAYLLSQGGEFNGIDVGPGIDAGDPTMAKTATLYVEVLTRLASGASYADLARTLEQTCAELAVDGTAGFDAADCSTVALAVGATELTLPPLTDQSAPLPDAPRTCPDGWTRETLMSYDGSGDIHDHFWTPELWHAAPYVPWGVPSNARSGTESVFGFNPDPNRYGDPRANTLLMNHPVAVPTGARTFLHFGHWRLFSPLDGGTVQLRTDSGGTWHTEVPGAESWVNGPTDTIVGDKAGFGGDSHGWTTSRLELTPQAGSSVEPGWTVRGDDSGSLMGWYLDDIEIYSCTPPPVAPSAVSGLTATASGDRNAVLGWRTPSSIGTGVTGYDVTLPNGEVRATGPTPRWTEVTVPDRSKDWSYLVRARGTQGLVGPTRSVTVWSTRLALRSAPSAARKGQDMVFRGRARATSTTTVPAGRSVTLQVRKPGTTTWSSVRRPDGSVRTARVASDGAVTLRAPGTGTTRYYRLAFAAQGAWLRAWSGGVRVAARR